ncbi:hypothetical protein AB7942_23970 [Neobacillus sp. BF23-41]|uniref:hypothetical protein n=1 Tax=Neobacillus sp. BF23-41 TaxID=3240280 RepID=UPI0034E4A6F3
MKYFVLYVTFNDDSTDEFYLKGKSMKHMEERIQRYSNGALSTSKWTIMTSNAKSSFLREVDPSEYPHLTKHDFVQINENSSYDVSDLA